MMEEYADDQARRSGLPEPQRSEARMELHSHIYEAARERAEEAGAERIEIDHVRAAIDAMDVGDEEASSVVARRRAELGRGSFGRRAVAYAIDFVILMIAVNLVLAPILFLAVAPLPFVTGGAPMDCDPSPFGVDCDGHGGAWWMVGPWMAFWTLGHHALVVLGFAAFEVTLGQTPGKMVMDLRATREDGGDLDWTKGILRNVAKAFPFLVLVDAVAGYLVDDQARERLSDRIAGTIVVEEAR